MKHKFNVIHFKIYDSDITLIILKFCLVINVKKKGLPIRMSLLEKKANIKWKGNDEVNNNNKKKETNQLGD